MDRKKDPAEQNLPVIPAKVRDGHVSGVILEPLDMPISSK